MSVAAFQQYAENIRREHATGQATEHSYRDSLKNLMLALEAGLTVINEPKRIEVGAPDYIIERDAVLVGHIEAKDVDVNLDRLDRRSKEQLQGYLAAIPNLIHTNYLDFRWYVNGELRESVTIGELKRGKLVFNPDAFEDAAALLNRFLNTVTATIDSPRELVGKMAKMAREIKRLIVNSLPDSEMLKAEMAAFEATLIPNLTADDFADMYAQTLAYGLFAARTQHKGKPEDFTLRSAFWNLPQTNPFLRRFFQDIVPELDERVSWQVDILANLLAHTDMDDILRDFGRRTRQEDPVVHFYETFLREYDPQKREQRGVYYTPEPVVSYIVRSVDHLLRSRFDRANGLADENALVLDPATGTGTFLYHVIRHVYESVKGEKQPALWQSYVREKLLPRLFGFELLMAPYAVAHMKLGLQLQQTGYQFDAKDRLGIYLTNTLEEISPEGQKPLGIAGFITEESNKATAIKRAKPIMVVLGNPPYSGHSANKGDWIGKLVRDYYTVDGKPLGERNPKWLQDDYVKFIRFGQWRIDQTGSGVLAYVTNHSYLDNPTFRGMRQQLMDAFTDIYILNLHGNSKKKEKTPDGGKDENVFDIQQGVAIALFVKEEGKTGRARIHHADLWGEREGKYRALTEQDIVNTTWTTLEPQAPYYLFTPQNIDLRDEYQQGWKITDVMAVNVLGFQTHRDSVAIGYTRSQVESQVKTYLGDLSAEVEKTIDLCTYRPFDIRYAVYSTKVNDRPRPELVQHVVKRDNYSLLLIRQMQDNIPYSHVLVSKYSSIDRTFTASRGAATVFPLYLYPAPDDNKLIDVEGDWKPGKGGRTPNLNPKFVRELEAKLGLTFVSDGRGDLDSTFAPEDVFHYTYAVFHSPEYRERYAEFLKIDFPRLPLTSDKTLFRALCEHGAALVDLHLLRGAAFADVDVLFCGEGESVVMRGYPKYTEPAGSKQGQVHINKTQYFEPVAPEVWKFHVGGYQVLDKWLKDRRERALSFDDITHYKKIVVALSKTIEHMDAIDALIPDWPLP